MNTSFVNQLAENPLFRSIPGFVFIKDRNSDLVVCSDDELGLIGFKSNDEARGKGDHEVRCKAAEHAELYRRQDQLVIAARQAKKFICAEVYADGNRHILLCEKKPIFDESGSVEALWGNAVDITHQVAYYLSDTSLALFLNSKEITTFEIASNLDQTVFTKTESKIAFLLLHGCLVPQIAAQLHRSKRTIESHVENMRNKFHLTTTHDLIEYLKASPYVNCILDQL